jgi:uncharacterized protein
MMQLTNTVVAQTKNWIESIVIALDLCPFAKFPFQQDLIRYVVAKSDTEVDLLNHFHEELLMLYENDKTAIETTLIIIPEGWADFMDYLDLVELAQEVLEELELEGVIQIASFHPDYQFEDLDEVDVRNYTNRSPYPMIHLLREDSVTHAVDTYPNVEQIPDVNQDKLLQLGLDFFKKK